ncbi:hypothetical protein B566_EDAN014411 [Ephemera danica]|nr:hypothetical protein B566_EDAN014411 [Ephemera danica]
MVIFETTTPLKVADEPRGRSGSWDEAAAARLGAGCGGAGVVGASVVAAVTAVQQQQEQTDLHAPTCPTAAVLRQLSSDQESWDSAASDVSSGDESSERSTKAPSSRGSSINSNRSNGNIKSTLNKILSSEKWRGESRASGGGGSVNNSRTSSSASLMSAGSVPVCDTANTTDSSSGRLSRWFSIRRGNHYDVDRLQASAAAAAAAAASKMPQLPEEEEAGSGFTFQRRQPPPSLPPPPPGLTSEQAKRRHIVAAIVHSENSYVATLQRLVNDFKKELEESTPAILSASKIGVLFHRLPEILQCHTLFRIALSESVRNWDREERLGDVFVASFSKPVVLDVYSDFINNFSIAMDLAKQESKRKSALADFLKVKQISAHDRLSFFGLMVKPVQRFPQFILFLQDLLKHTPHGHHDRMSLQLALTELESLAEMLNERKREAEQFQAFREMLRHVSSKFAVRPLSDSNRYLLREDNVTQLEFNQSGMITKSKSRRLLLLNDLLVQDTSASPTLSRLLTAGLNKGGSLKSDRSSESSVGGVDNLCQEMNDLMHDYEVVSRISDLISTLRTSYKGLTVEGTRQILSSIQSSIQHKDEEIAWVDSCCLQFTIRTKPGKEEQFTFQTENPNIKKEWVTELRLAQLALDPNNSPAWDIPEQERRPSTKMPLFVRCGCYYTVMSVKPTRRPRPQNYLWICTTDGVSSYVTVLAQQQAGMREVSSFHLTETKMAAMEFVPGVAQGSGLAGDTVWLGTDSRRFVLFFCSHEPERQQEVGSCLVPAVIQQIRYHCDQTFVALANGCVLLFRRGAAGEWALQEHQNLILGTDPVSSLLPINVCMYAACGKKVWVINALNGDIQKSFSVQHEQVGNVNLMAHAGIGLWISMKNSPIICLYHTETFKHLQDINIASNVMRMVYEGHDYQTQYKANTKKIYVTALMACKGLLWVGTNVGCTLTIPLPRLEGVPIISGRVNISYHSHFGPISFLLALHPRGVPGTETCLQHKPSVSSSSSSASSSGGSVADGSAAEAAERARLEKQLSDGALLSPAAPRLRHQLSSPVVIRRRAPRNEDISRRASKTLPRGAFSALGCSQDCDVYGLYGDLMNVRDYEEDGSRVGGTGDSSYEALRRSDPELAAIPGKVSTLDRRLRIKSSRPRSLDLSNWSVDSRSSSLYTSSGSEDSVQVPSLRLPNADQVITSTPTQVSQANSRPDGSSGPSKVVEMPRTIITLMGGRGYVKWRRPTGDKGKPGTIETNSNDAHIVLWEMKL